MIVNRFPFPAGAPVYGVNWDGTKPTQWIRTDAAAGFADPVPYISGASTYGSPFDNISPWKDMIRVTDADAGEMVKIPKFWYKITANGSSVSDGIKVQITSKEKTGFNVCPACMNRGDGNGERDYILVGRYHYGVGTGKSTTRVKPRTGGSKSFFPQSGTGVYLLDFSALFTIWLLYLVEFANTDSTHSIGMGGGNNSATGNMGYTDSMPYHTGTTLSSRTTFGLGTQYRYIEGLWDNVYDFVEGTWFAENGKGLMIITNPLKFGKTYNSYSYCGTTTSGIYPSYLAVKDSPFNLFAPSSFSSKTNSCIGDEWSIPSSGSTKSLIFGNSYIIQYNAGLFSVRYITESYGTFSTYGARPMKLP